MKNRYDMYMLISSKHVHILWSSVVKGQQTSCIHKLDYMWPLQRTTDKLYTQAWLHVTSTKDNRQVVYTSLVTCDLYKGQQTSCIHKLGYMWHLQRTTDKCIHKLGYMWPLQRTTDKLYTQAWLHVTSTKDNRQVVYTSLVTCDLYKDTEGSWTTDKLYTQAWLHVTSTKMQKGRVLYMYLIDLLRKSL
jgi:predicted transcriptional regulator